MQLEAAITAYQREPLNPQALSALVESVEDVICKLGEVSDPDLNALILLMDKLTPKMGRLMPPAFCLMTDKLYGAADNEKLRRYLEEPIPLSPREREQERRKRVKRARVAELFPGFKLKGMD